MEIRNAEVSKGRAAKQWIEDRDWDCVIALGNDETDEDTFEVVWPLVPFYPRQFVYHAIHHGTLCFAGSILNITVQDVHGACFLCNRLLILVQRSGGACILRCIVHAVGLALGLLGLTGSRP